MTRRWLNKMMNDIRHWINLCGGSQQQSSESSLTESSTVGVNEVAPDNPKAERFIKKHKREFKKRYGKRGDQVLYATAWKKFSEAASEEYGDSMKEKPLGEEWDTEYETPERKKGMWDGWSKERLQKRRNALRAKDERSDAESTELKQINFALRAKSGWGKVGD